MAVMATSGRTVPIWRAALWGTVAALLLAPAVAMRFTDEVTWTGSDFVVAALLLGAAAGLVELAMRTIAAPLRRAAAVGAVVLVLLLVWLQGAVGLV